MINIRTVCLLIGLSLNGCSDPSSAVQPADAVKPNPLTGETMQVISEENSEYIDLHLSFSGVRDMPKSRAFNIQSNYAGENIGFIIWLPKKGFSGGRLESTGVPSNNFLQILQQLYKQKEDGNSRFVDSLTFTCLDLYDVFNKDSVSDPSSVIAAQYKLFFEGPGDNYAELYLDINEAQHWIEWKEKDEDYRSPLIKILTKK